MLEDFVKFPSAQNFKTGKPTTIKDVKYEERLNFICPDCEKSFIAVLNHSTPHFKHKPNSSCVGSFESNIHWLTKEIFKTIKEFKIPEINIDDLPEKQRELYQLTFNKIMEPNIPEKLRPKFRKAVKREFIDERKVLVGNTEIEKQFKTDIGNIVVDIITYSENERMFIEPFYSNPINKEKKEKLSKIGIQTLSINLNKFIDNFKLNFNNQKLKDYLISKESKEWALIKIENFDNHLKNYEKYLLKFVELNKSTIDSYYSKLDEIEKLKTKKNKKIKKLNKIESQIESQIEKLENKIIKIQREIDS